ncbi:MAG: radical SAM protein [Bacteroidaceae bacterium]|nr:radical SAM protein [Bacteroidaceae bacterium]
MNSIRRYDINEIFYSLQGEGFHTGTPAVFVRFAGCNLRCPFCDTQFDARMQMTAEEIVARVWSLYPQNRPSHDISDSSGAESQIRPIVILTGGEPSLQVDNTLIQALHNAGLRIHIETNGTHELPDGIDWITCSPKNATVILARMDELKVVFQGQDLSQYDKYDCHNRFLQPCSNGNVPETVAAVKTNPLWRLSLQTHIIIGIK